MEILYGDKFQKQYNKAPKPVRVAFRKRISLFEKDVFHILLHNHQLTGKYSGHRSINITGDWRAVYRESIDTLGNAAYHFIVFGTHSQLYK